MSEKRKLKMLSLEDKVKVLEAVERGNKKKSEIAADFKIPPNTLSTYLKNKDKILKAYEELNFDPKRKKSRVCDYPELDKCMIKWVEQTRSKNIPLSGALMLEKAQSFSTSLGYVNFKASTGWLESFKARHQISFRRVCGESESVSEAECTEWKDKLPRLTHGYESKDIFNADETGLFFKCLPDKTMALKGDTCHGGKQSKERVTILLGANVTGTEKLPLLFIGKSKKPRCFAGVKSLPLQYEANKKAWMNSEMFAEWLKKINRIYTHQKRKILLFIDNCPAHNIIPKMPAVTVKFLPPNTTSKLQPMDQGIIQNFKHFYRKLVIKKLLNDIDEGQQMDMNILHAIYMTAKAWDSVSVQTIANCFKKAGFKSDLEAVATTIGLEVVATTTDLEAVATTSDTEIEWGKIIDVLKISESNDLTFETFLNFDADLAVCETLSEEEIIHGIKATEEISGSESEDDHKDAEIRIPTFQESKEALNTLRNFFLSKDNVSEAEFHTLLNIENAMDNIQSRGLKQAKVTDYFKS